MSDEQKSGRRGRIRAKPSEEPALPETTGAAAEIAPLEPAKAPEAAKPSDPGSPGEGLKWFEAPDGTLIPGEADADSVQYRTGGQVVWINPRR